MILLRRMGRERQATLSIDEAAATMKLLYDDFSTFCQPEHLSSAMDWVMDRLERRRASGKSNVRLCPCPRAPKTSTASNVSGGIRRICGITQHPRRRGVPRERHQGGRRLKAELA
jgi:hypothetical protein